MKYSPHDRQEARERLKQAATDAGALLEEREFLYRMLHHARELDIALLRAQPPIPPKERKARLKDVKDAHHAFREAWHSEDSPFHRDWR